MKTETETKSLLSLELEGWHGPDVDLGTSLAEHGLAWVHRDDRIAFIYRCPYVEGKWQMASKDAETDVQKECDWVDWEGLFSYLGAVAEDWLMIPLEHKVFDLVGYHGALEVFGDNLSSPFRIAGLEDAQ